MTPPIRLAAAAVASGLVVLTVTGCAGGTATPSPTVTVTAPAPSPDPSEDAPAPAEERTASTPFDAWDAYLFCKYAATPMLGGATTTDFSNVDIASFEDSEVIARNDGLFYVYSETVFYVDSVPREAAINCIVGGTVGSQTIGLVGAQVRQPTAERDPNQELGSH